MSQEVNDPRRRTSLSSASVNDVLQLSRNEIESVCSKAARGAGMSWGLAEEAGYAAGWLAAQGLDGGGLLAKHLRFAMGQPWQDICPVVASDEWHATTTAQPLCPIALGTTLSDHLSLDHGLVGGHGLRVGDVSSPVLVLPFVAMAAVALNKTVFVRFAHHVVSVNVCGTLGGDVSALMTSKCSALSIMANESTTEPDSLLQDNQLDLILGPHESPMVPLGSNALAFLYKLSIKTTVPASAASRGNAGGVGSDND